MKALMLERAQATRRHHDLIRLGKPLMFVHGLGRASSYDYPRVATDPALAADECV